jgi:hypothetical protein
MSVSQLPYAWIADDTDHSKAYDSHCNLILGDVEETIYVVDEDDEDEESVKVKRASSYRKPTRD